MNEMTRNQSVLEGLTPDAVWRHFGELAARPRPSGEEEAVRSYVLNWADGHGFPYKRDEVGNVVIEVPPRGKGVGCPKVLIQGHLDMVCEKNGHVEHDFFTDPIQLIRKDDRIFANETTLGADNGIGVSLALAAGDGLFPDHPPLELLLTVDEETGMSGARELDASMITARKMINLDAEEEGVLYVGCAGGMDTIVTVPVEREEAVRDESSVMGVTLRGLKGGHSGLDIGLNRGNAIRLLSQVLKALPAEVQLIDFNGGSKRNAIPREASALIRLGSPALETRVIEILTSHQTLLKDLHGDSEKEVLLAWDYQESSVPSLTEDCTRKLLSFLFVVPIGVVTLSQAIEGMVETSNNLGVVSSDGQEFTVVLCSRSSNGPALKQLTAQITGVADLCGVPWRFHGGYPGWQPNRESVLLKISEEVFAELNGGIPPEVTAIHAGLECGLLGDVIPGMDMVAFGPDIQDAHSPEESVSIPSVGVVAKQVEALLKALCVSE